MNLQSALSENWKPYELSEIITLIRGGTPQTTKTEYLNSEIPCLSLKEFNNDFRYVYTTEKTITQLELEQSSTTLLQKDDIVISARGTVGKTAMIPYPMAFSQSFFGIRAKIDLVDSVFLYYLLNNNIKMIKNNAQESGFDTIKRDTFDGINIDLPPLPVQKKIASILSSLDDKIELNTRMNNVLEEIARALFRRWFVAFEFPNAEGKPYKSAGGKMVESDEKSVPEGWHYDTLEQLIELSYGKPLKEENRTGSGYPVFGSNGIVGWHNEWMVDGPGIIVGRKGNAGKVTWSHENFFPIDTTFYVVSKLNPGCFHYLYFLLQSLRLSYLSADSVVPGINRDDVLEQTIHIPHIETIIEFEKIVSALFSQMKLLDTENMVLISTRDIMLPKLMSGGIDLSGISSPSTLTTFTVNGGA